MVPGKLGNWVGIGGIFNGQVPINQGKTVTGDEVTVNGR